MNRTVIAVLAIASICVGVAVARPRGIGLGLTGGDPAGLSAKIWTGPHVALDAGFGYSYWQYGQAAHAHGDVLWHTSSLTDSAANGYLPLYVGLGARVKLPDESHDYPDLRAGLRIPFGVEYVFAGSPLGLFFELVPTFDLTPAIGLSGNGVAGFRYYFGGLTAD